MPLRPGRLAGVDPGPPGSLIVGKFRRTKRGKSARPAGLTAFADLALEKLDVAADQHTRLKNTRANTHGHRLPLLRRPRVSAHTPHPQRCTDCLCYATLE
jgi:hypothetical protein